MLLDRQGALRRLSGERGDSLDYFPPDIPEENALVPARAKDPTAPGLEVSEEDVGRKKLALWLTLQSRRGVRGKFWALKTPPHTQDTEIPTQSFPALLAIPVPIPGTFIQQDGCGG